MQDMAESTTDMILWRGGVGGGLGYLVNMIYIELFFFFFISVGRSFHKLMVDGRKLSK